MHKFDPRMKLVLTIVYIILLFAASNPLGLTLSLVFLVAMYGVAKIPFKLITKSLKPILPIILFTAVLNLFFVSGEGEPLVHFWVLNIYAEGLRYAIPVSYTHLPDDTADALAMAITFCHTNGNQLNLSLIHICILSSINQTLENDYAKDSHCHL